MGIDCFACSLDTLMQSFKFSDLVTKEKKLDTPGLQVLLSKSVTGE